MMTKVLTACCILVALVSGCIGSGSNSHRPPYDGVHPRIYAMFLDPDIDTIVVDVDYVEGREPSSLALAGLKENLEMVFVDKIVVIERPTVVRVGDTSNQKNWSHAELREIAQRHRDPSGASAWVIHAVYLNGYAVSYGYRASGVFLDAAFVFPDPLYAFLVGDVALQRNLPMQEGERTTLSHEVGHALGLVNLEIPMVTPRLPSKEDDPCQCHSNQPDSVMFSEGMTPEWIRETIESRELSPYLFNQDDLTDIHTFIERQTIG